MLRVRHPDVEADATCVDEAQYLAVYAPKGWALVVDEDDVPVTTDTGVPTAHLGGPPADGVAAPIPAPVVDPEPDVVTPPESPVSVPEPRPDPSEFVDFDAPTTPDDGDAVESEED